MKQHSLLAFPGQNEK